MVNLRGTPWVLVLAIVSACSTVIDPNPLCSTDDDCPEGRVCLTNFGGTCYDASLVAPLRDLGFALCDRQNGAASDECGLQIEVLGCDLEFERISPSSFEVERKKLIESIVLDWNVVFPDGGETPVRATFELSQPSRLNAGSWSVQGEFTPGSENLAVAFPYYDRRDASTEDLADAFRSLVASMTPIGEAWAPFSAYIMRPATSDTNCETNDDCDDEQYCVDLETQDKCSPQSNSAPYAYHLTTPQDCYVTLAGRTVEVPIAGAAERLGSVDMSLRFPTNAADPLAVPPVGDDLPCDSDDQCLPGVSYCDESRGSCVLNLAGRRASVPFSSNEVGAIPGIRVYTYCELAPAVTARTLTLTAQDHDRTLPQMTYTFDQALANPSLPGFVCLPQWEPPQDVEVRVVGDPVELFSADGQTWRCCDTSCLPVDETSLPVDEATQCNGAAGSPQAPIAPAIRLESVLEASEVDSTQWMAQGCLEPQIVDGVAGRVSRINTSCAARDEPCVIAVSPGPPGGPSRDYTIRIEPRAGSALASAISTVQIGPTMEDPVVIELPPRPRIHGRVRLPEASCDNGSDCGAKRATVMAERLRVAGDDPQRVQGPFFYTTTTFYDPETGSPGAYVLPVNPGIYVVTALPDSRTVGAPAEMVVVDISEGVRREQDLVLSENGVPVRVALKGFTSDASVEPLDLGSWRSICHPDADSDEDGCSRTLDLNAPDECYRETDPGAGCSIRTLGSVLYPNVADEVRFLARPGSDECSE